MLPPNRSTAADRIRAMLKGRRQPQQKYMTDMDMPGVDMPLPPPRAAVESGAPSPLELRQAPPPKQQPAPQRKPQRLDAPTKEKFRKLF